MTNFAFVYGTRPEIIKLAPIVKLLNEPCLISTGQQRDLTKNVVSGFPEPNYDLDVMKEDQTPNQVLARILTDLEHILEEVKPRMVVVQGDTTSALAGALCARTLKIPVAHVEAGLRTYRDTPHPEEMNRRIISALATYHLCPTYHNFANLHGEGIFNYPDVGIKVVGSTALDALRELPENRHRQEFYDRFCKDRRVILFTMHRRDNFDQMASYLSQIDRFLTQRPDIVCVWPVHPNPTVQKHAQPYFKRPQWYLIDPMDHERFTALAKQSWLILSDSGGIQEEVTILKRPLVILRENTERPEVLALNYVDLVEDSLLAQLEDWERRLAGNFVFTDKTVYKDSAAALIVSVLVNVSSFHVKKHH